ncbi:fasciclin domain-containing protein [Aequorivita sp. SDUM287046]|uniref:Fasciclin domain-containing protein n=1 Tax=Aequorivita aurantiaca TaxID=3053356 RepID=A0ABT8DGN6_9FLAO|nr:fasciclin domain-containing protein [Aequorivita aurantiaca]MDN3723839.1 fasciclin domain-containing protein [Aequorivita aurantiaca]
MYFKNLITLLLLACFSINASAQKYLSKNNAEVSRKLGESTFTSNKSFYQNIEEAPDFTVLASVLKNAPSRQKLEGMEAVTIFAIADEGFLNLPKKSRDSILGNPKIMNSIITMLAVPGRIDSNTLKNEIAKQGSNTYLKTIEGNSLRIREVNGTLQLVDSENRTANIIASDFYHKNGFFHIIDSVIFPNSEE